MALADRTAAQVVDLGRPASTASYAPCRLEPLTTDHLRALGRLDLGLWPARHGDHVADLDARQQLRLLVRPGSFAIVRLGAVVGLLTMAWDGFTAEVFVAVDAVRRGRGVGATALGLAAETARQRGGGLLVAHVGVHDVTGIAVLRAAGFRLVGLERGAGPHGTDRLRYEQTLDPRASSAAAAA
jgi:GNAT superfamily N-acetyltransferase